MSRPLYAVYGVSGFGREVMPLARAELMTRGVALEDLVFVDDDASVSAVNGHRVMSYEEFLRAESTERFAAIAIANGKIRESVASKCKADGVKAWSIMAPSSSVMDDVSIGEGAVICALVTITSNIRIGRHFHANIYSYAAHDCVIGDYVTFAPAVHCNGNVVVEDHVYLGTGAFIKQGKPSDPLIVGRGAVVGMGAVVTRSVAAGVTVVGNPARPMERR